MDLAPWRGRIFGTRGTQNIVRAKEQIGFENAGSQAQVERRLRGTLGVAKPGSRFRANQDSGVLTGIVE